ncbi:MAG: ATP-binding cassette domain-containing protein [Bacteroidia bacterium]|nr:ATP-binding cassette domain-containing protein [Bacteroidia bacterium]
MANSFTITLDQVGKQYYQRWLFRDLNLSLIAGESLALVGQNGSGKSTLLRVIAGQLSPSVGKVTYGQSGKRVPSTEIYRHISWSAPYISLFPELTLREQYRLQARFGSFFLKEDDFLETLLLADEADKPLRFYSSGMLQRAKTGLAILADSSVLMLDEPTSNMDDKHAALIISLIRQYQQSRIVILASNLEREYGEIARQIHLGVKE